jgi:ABC-type antimicrobial peptide transport system permease subunit
VGLPYHEVVVKQMRDVERQGQVRGWVNLCVGIASAVVAAVILGLTARSWVGGQRPQIGMLKAMGGDDGLLMRASLLESRVLWGMGLVGGGVLAGLVTAGLSWAWSWGPAVWAKVEWPMWEMGAVVVGSLVVCVGSSWAATRSVAARSPIELIRTT